MIFALTVQPRAQADIRRQVVNLIEHISADFAALWAAEVDTAVLSLRQMPERCGLASEAAIVDLALRQLLVGRWPHIYRILFVVREYRVYVVRVRHSAQASLTRSDITLPRGGRE